MISRPNKSPTNVITGKIHPIRSTTNQHPLPKGFKEILTQNKQQKFQFLFPILIWHQFTPTSHNHGSVEKKSSPYMKGNEYIIGDTPIFHGSPWWWEVSGQSRVFTVFTSGFPKIVGFPNKPIGPLLFLLKMIMTWGVFWGYHHLRKPPTWASTDGFPTEAHFGLSCYLGSGGGFMWIPWMG